MAESTVSEHTERVVGRRWTVRVDGAGRGSGAVRVSCNQPACAEQRLPSAAAGRAAAIAHIKDHLQAASAPEAQAYCACRTENCRTHIRPDDRKPHAGGWRCGGPVVLAVVADREGRWWQAMECCSRCAAAIPSAKVVATASAGLRRPGPPAGFRPPSVPPVGTPQFSDGTTGVAVPRRVPGARSAPRRRPPAQKVAQRVIPHDLQPAVLREELIEIGDLFRSYQQRTEPDLAVLAALHERKARAFTTWADVTGDRSLRLEAERAEQAAAAALLQHQHRTGTIAHEDGDPAVPRLLTSPLHWDHVRSVITHVAAHAPVPGPDARLLTLMVTLRTAHTGTGNLVGQDVNGLGLGDPEQLIQSLLDSGWLEMPATAAELLAARPEAPVPITVPTLLPGPDEEGPFTFGRKARAKLSGWAQRAVGDKKLRKSKAPAPVRLLALTLATETTPAGQLGADGEGIALDVLRERVPVDHDELQQLVDRLTATDWLTEATLTETHLTGQLTERVLPLTCPWL